MAHINPVWPNDGDPGWGDTLNANFNTMTSQINSHDDQIASLGGGGGSAPSATTSSQGIVQLAGDLAGTASAPVLKSIITAGSVGSTTRIPVITYDGKGRITTATTVAAPSGGGSSSYVTVLSGTGIDPTGATDSASAVQAILTAATDGTTIVVPDGATIRCNSGLTIAHRIKFGGAGVINFYNLTGSGHVAGVTITADNASLVGLNIANPSMTAPDNTTNNGNSQFGVLIKANDVLVAGCWVDKFQSGIVVDSHGEYERTRIMYNRVSDVLGAGNGPSDTTSHNGEDRGDGICNWGDRATIVGNIVTCISGGDARIGIHTEALSTQETTPTPSSDSMVTISGNIVSGKFRRGIVAEGVSRVAITGNTVSDSTWWNIAIIGNSQNSLIVGNTCHYTRTSTDNQGQALSPARAPIMLYINSSDLHGPVVANNAIHIASTATTSSGIRSTGDGVHTIYDAVIEGNTIWDESGTMAEGIRFSQFAVRPKVTGNSVNFFQTIGIYFGNANEVSVANNTLVGAGLADTGSRGVHLTTAGTGWQINGNTISDCEIGIYCPNGTEVQINSNRIARTVTGINAFGTTAPFVIVGNLFSSTVTNPYASVTGNAVQAGNSN